MVESFKSHLFKSKFAKYNLLKIRVGALNTRVFVVGVVKFGTGFYIPYYKGKKKLCKLYTNPTFNHASF